MKNYSIPAAILALGMVIAGFLLGSGFRAGRSADRFVTVKGVVITSYDLELYTSFKRYCDEGNQRFPGDYRLVECKLQLMTTSAEEADPTRAWQLLYEMVSAAPEPMRVYQRLSGEIWVAGVLGWAGLPDSAQAVLERATINPQADITTLDLLPQKAFS